MLVAATAASCQELPPPVFDVLLHVDSDPDVPLAGAVVIREGKEVATTDATGNARLNIQGTEGAALDYFVRCPTDYDSPTKPITVILRSVLDKNRAPQWGVICPPQVRRVVVAVRAEGGQFLPVTYLGQRVATTDASGAATILLNMRPGDQFELKLDTSMKGYERLAPKSPIQAFLVKPKDEVIPWNFRFVMQKLKVIRQATWAGPKEVHTPQTDL